MAGSAATVVHAIHDALLKPLHSSMDFFGLHLAPLLVPLERRIQTFAVICWITNLLLGPIIIISYIYLFIFTSFYWLPLIYLAFYIYDFNQGNRGGRRFEWARKMKIWKYYADFFPIRLVKTTHLDPKHNYIVGNHPHGILSAGVFCNFATEGTGFGRKYPGLVPHVLTLEGNLQIPGMREYAMSLGACSANRPGMEHLLKLPGKRRLLVLVIGGAPEALDSRPGFIKLNLKKRKGFCKMALRHGAHLVPSFSFGETDVYDQVSNPEGSWLRWLQDQWERHFGLAPALFMGRGIFQYNFGILPFRRPITTVVGSPIAVDKVDEPSREEVADLHRKYTEALVSLYEEHKDKYLQNPETELIIG